MLRESGAAHCRGLLRSIRGSECWNGRFVIVGVRAAAFQLPKELRNKIEQLEGTRTHDGQPGYTLYRTIFQPGSEPGVNKTDSNRCGPKHIVLLMMCSITGPHSATPR